MTRRSREQGCPVCGRGSASEVRFLAMVTGGTWVVFLGALAGTVVLRELINLAVAAAVWGIVGAVVTAMAWRSKRRLRRG